MGEHTGSTEAGGWDAPFKTKVKNRLGKAVRWGFVASFKTASAASRALHADKYFGRIINETKPFGLDVYPMSDFYSPMPLRERLAANKDRWCKPSAMVGIHYDLDAMRQKLTQLIDTFGDEWAAFDYEADTKKGFGPGFTEVDALVMYSTLRDIKPGRYIEVGSGLSTYYALQANARNQQDGRAARMTCIDPFPFDRLKQEKDVEIIAQEVQDTDFSVFEQLGEGDVLFIDSTHIVRVDGDVPFMMLEILPRLKPGVTIHIHDIPFPYNVPFPADAYIFNREWPWYFNEPMLLQAFLCGNDNFGIQMSVPMLVHFDRPFIETKVPDYQRIITNEPFPACSIWLKRLK